MYDGYNCGEKIKNVANAYGAIGVIASAIISIAVCIFHMTVVDEITSLVAGILMGLISGGLFWLNGLLIYAFGELVDCAALQKKMLLSKDKNAQRIKSEGRISNKEN